VETGTPVFSDILPAGPQGEDVVAVAVPITDIERRFRGAIVGFFLLWTGPEVRASSFQAGLFHQLRQWESGDVYVVDAAGRAIYHSDTWHIGEDTVIQGLVEEAGEEERGNHIYNEEGVPILASLSPVPGTPWTLVTEESWTALMEASQPYRRLLILLLGLGVAVPAVVITVGVRRITRPIADLTRAAREVAGGRFDRVIHVETGDELEELARQFNRMSSELEASYATLEQRVEDRTRELAALNAITAVVSRSLELEEILHDALDKILEVTGMEVGAAYRLEETGRTLALMAHRGLSEPFVRHVTRVPVRFSAAGLAKRTGRPVVMRVSEYPESRLKGLMHEEGLEMAVSIPILAKGEVLGAINLGSRAVRKVGPEELAMLAAVGQQTGIAVENARLYEHAEEAAAAAERNRLARELHDAVSQTLFSAQLIADVLPRLWERNPAEGQRRLEELRQLTRGALAEMRTLLLEMRPAALAQAELPELLRQLTEAVTGRARIPVRLEIEGECTLPVERKIGLYRIAQEALNNVVKHAAAQEVVVRLACGEEGVELLVADDGRGFDPDHVPPDHLGLSIMQERAEAAGATLRVESEPGEGTRVTAKIAHG
jgi:nitrate/nitrite-specific signal transduction histidine kinase